MVILCLNNGIYNMISTHTLMKTIPYQACMMWLLQCGMYDHSSLKLAADVRFLCSMKTVTVTV